jgi:hypothetical protein
VAVKLLGPAQVKVVPEVVDVAVTAALLGFMLLQFSGPLLPAVTLAGTVISCATVAEAVAVHPVEGLVAVIVYVPGTVAVAVAPVAVKLFDPVHAKVAPEVVEVPVSVTLVLEQVNVPELAAVTLPGAVRSCVTVVEAAIAVHPGR